MNKNQIEAISRARASWYPSSENRIVATMLGEVKIVLDRRDFSLTPHIVMSGFWESWVTAWFLRNLTVGYHCLNIGANCGYYALAALRAGCKVAAVEPQPHLAKNLSISAFINGWQDRLVIHQVVAGVEEREVELQLYPEFQGSAHVATAGELGYPELAGNRIKTREVPAHALMPSATCVFVDAEGYEPYIWKGLKPLLDAKQLRWIALEWAPLRYPDAAAFLGELRAVGDVSVIGSEGQEARLTDQQLLSAGDLDMVVVRPR
jgi:FkbM family methyltransferase